MEERPIQLKRMTQRQMHYFQLGQIKSRTPMNTVKHAALQGCVRLYQPTVVPTSRARREFSEFFTVFRFRKVLHRCLHS